MRLPLLLALLLPLLQGLAAERPNLIFFIADDVSWDDFGCYGNGAARTPHIDALAAGGLRFTRAYLTASSCSPSRSSIITGRYPHNNGSASELHAPIAGHLAGFPALLREAGYHTALSGKNHMTWAKPADGLEAAPEPWDLTTGGKTKGNSGGHADWVRLVKERPEDKPFFFWFAANDAHRGWDAEGQWDEEAFGPKHRPEEVVVPPFLIDEPGTRKDLASYYNEVTRYDHFIGRVVAELKTQGIFEKTLLFVCADNGRPFPRAKTRLHDSGMKTALVASWPAGIKAAPGSEVEAITSIIDLAPTYLQAAGIEVPETFQGVPLQPVFEDPEAEPRAVAFSEHNWHDYEAFGRSVRRGDYLYLLNERPEAAWQGPADSVRSPSHLALQRARDAGTLDRAQEDVFLAPRPRAELYKVSADPHQVNNLIDHPEHAAVREELAALLARWQEETGDSVPEDLTADGFDRETGKALKTGGKGDRGTPPGADRDAATNHAPGPR